MTVKRNIDEFLARKRIAIVGVSRGPKDFSRGLLREMQLRGYDTVPVNPNAEEIEGLRCFARVQDIDPPADGVIAMVPEKATAGIVRDCAEAGVTRIWLHGMGSGNGPGEEVTSLCEERGIALIPGHCPYMFLTETAWIHRFHAWILKVMGKYPE